MGAAGARALATGQGLYWAASGIWPLVHLPSFEAVTGPKPGQRWLVRTLGVLILVVGGTLALAGRRGRVTPELRLLGAAGAAGLGGAGGWYAAKGRIAPIYLADAALEAALVLGWLTWGRPRRAGGEAER